MTAVATLSHRAEAGPADAARSPVTVAAASVALRHREPGAHVVAEAADGPRFPNGYVPLPPPDGLADRRPCVVGGHRLEGPLLARRWWDPSVPVGTVDPRRRASYLATVSPLSLPYRPEDGIGWGPGLTPAGDDVVVGMLASWRAFDAPEAAAALTAAIDAGATTPFSRSLLDHAAAGRVVKPLLYLLLALQGRGRLDDAIDGLHQFGASSGRHVLDGVRRALVELDPGPGAAS